MPKIIIASGPVIVEDNKVLLDKHGDDIFWKFCGGTIKDFNYSLIESAQRRTLEEMGAKIEILNDKPFLFYNSKEIVPAGKIDILVAHYLAKRFTEITPGADIRQWKWIPLVELDELEKKGELAPSVIPALKHFGFIN